MDDNWGKPIFYPFELCIGKYPGLCKFFIKTSKCYPLFVFYYAVI